ncbi:MAG: amidohydrolase family protein [Gemmatimonadetes bacterium]|nr:amidohydrolase family protein [Gemmatimonadota bacterium]
MTRTSPPRVAAVIALVALGGCLPAQAPPSVADVLFLGGTIHDGSGAAARVADVAVRADRIVFVGASSSAGWVARDTVDAAGLLVVPGFIDMHSHAELDEAWGRDGLPFLYQGITTAVLGVDGGGENDVRARFAHWVTDGIGLNAAVYVGHNAARRAVMGLDDRPPTAEEQAALQAYVRRGMEEGALGLSSGLFYAPGSYAATEEVIALNRVAAEYGGIYDTHDRDLGASYRGVGLLASIEEGIRIGEEAGTPVIFSHFNPQGAHNYGRAPEAARLVEAARARGVKVAAAQHPYTATQSNLQAYTLPRWASAGGREAMLRRFEHPDTVGILDRQTMEMLEIRGGAEKIRFADPRPALSGRTLAEVAADWGLPLPEAVRRILREGNGPVMNLDLYDDWNTRHLATKPWMMTCTDGRTPAPGQTQAHPRPYGAFTRKLRVFALEEGVIDLPFAIRSMSGLAADFLGFDDRGYVREGMRADLAVLDSARVRDRATYDAPQRYSEGTIHVLVNGAFALRDGRPTGALAGVPLLRGGRPLGGVDE